MVRRICFEITYLPPLACRPTGRRLEGALVANTFLKPPFSSRRAGWQTLNSDLVTWHTLRRRPALPVTPGPRVPGHGLPCAGVTPPSIQVRSSLARGIGRPAEAVGSCNATCATLARRFLVPAQGPRSRSPRSSCRCVRRRLGLRDYLSNINRADSPECGSLGGLP